MLINHHAHTHFSDGFGTPEEFLEEALRQGLDGYGFSDHAPIPAGDIGSMKMDQLPEYSRKIDAMRAAYGGRIRVYKSLEVDYLPGVMNVNSPHILEAGLDYTVGAVHYVETLSDGMPWSFQRPNPVFEQGIREIFGGEARKMVERYYELVREMVENHPPDVVAHLDRIKKRNVDGGYWDEHADWYVRAYEETLEAIAASGVILEVNTRGLYREDSGETYPSRWMVRRAHERGVPLQVNSDAHEVPHITAGYDFAYAALREMGAESETVFRDGAFVEVGLQQPV